MSALSPKGKGHARRNSFGQRDFSPSHTHGRRTPLYLNIFFFFVGMSVAWFIIHATTSSHDPNIDHSALMQIYRQRPEVAATATETQKEAPKTSPAPIAPQQQWQQSQLPFCNVENHADGEWEFDPTITQPPYVSHEWDGTCDTIEGYHNDPTHVNDGFPKHVRRELQWHWKPRTCRLAPYSRKNFCQLLAGRNILFVGDSIAAQHVLSFVHQMHSHKDDLWIRDEFWRQDMIQICQEYYPANEAIEKPRAGRHPTTGKALAGIRVGFRRNNFLHMHTEVNNTFVHRQLSTNQSWVLAIDEHQFDIVVMNSGIWMINASSYIDLVTQVHSYMKEHHPHTTVIWRSTQPGHAHCHTFWARPQKRLYDIRDNTGGDARFRWQEADERNRIAKSIWKEEFMDVATMTKLRPDGHMSVLVREIVSRRN